MKKNNKKKTSFSLSHESCRLLNQLSIKLCIPKTSILEIAIREYAKKELNYTKKNMH